MYSEIETIYKRESSYNKFINEYALIAIFLYAFFIIFGLFKFDYFLYLFFSVFILIIYIRICFIINLFCNFNFFPEFFKFKSNINRFNELLSYKDKQLTKKIIARVGVNKKTDLKIILEHYRQLSNYRLEQTNFYNILSIIIAFYSAFSNIFNNKNSLIYGFTYLIIFIIFFSFLYYTFRQIVSLKRLLSGENNLYQNLENLFTEEYINYKK